ncbi:IS110 family transposase [Gloeobacter kilaueensis]|uniref:Transposase IS116/IS110/IS902 family protein n=1 Tax=Gloeobacter kilaueensis (strain ATCC BAA-2537 / CCAP 1431/1 / ULC 316 / JS1) TaxID=1183438 RepID=U5QLM0_GLOK1|nr:IS110 family transposase [Gloeobacter kilaueensis]AGY56294.1 transposase IS116/IS110/IS902 family protein [Gloeobacter kilaueensis JS1]AGY56552.1 transposase IS116/IS110/IS902 family protein [Gloeobacter kilaueensis JS1]AGY56661.1 transposase IS116/IS110/IS902 family protein [Gloeobacter kilaueensis JS1]AGY56810.1 transposase IS116/IS110/IS902 family protein [Gloeobacter kilaueensis JS1]AGY57197.1 transposase IS116/IS110/IS902 family protein [Gloeobacter kilaueensis JS1]
MQRDGSQNDYQLFVGIDVAALTVTAAWLLTHAKPTAAITLPQTPEGHCQLAERLLAVCPTAAEVLVVIEATGSYWMRLATFLALKGFAVSVVNPAQSHYFARALLKRSKSDALDAQTLAQLAAALQPGLWQPPPEIYYQLQQRLQHRDALLQQRQQLHNQLHALRQFPLVVAAVQASLEQLSHTFDEQIAQMEAQLEALLAQDSLWHQAATKLRTIKGIGSVTAGWVLVSTLNFGCCATVEAAVAYAGLAPRSHRSGTSLHRPERIGHAGNARLRTALYMASLSAIRCNQQIKSFYQRLRAAGKPAKVALCAAARKLLHIAWAVVKTDTPFDAEHGRLVCLQ